MTENPATRTVERTVTAIRNQPLPALIPLATAVITAILAITLTCTQVANTARVKTILQGNKNNAKPGEPLTALLVAAEGAKGKTVTLKKYSLFQYLYETKDGILILVEVTPFKVTGVRVSVPPVKTAADTGETTVKGNKPQTDGWPAWYAKIVPAPESLNETTTETVDKDITVAIPSNAKYTRSAEKSAELKWPNGAYAKVAVSNTDGTEEYERYLEQANNWVNTQRDIAQALDHEPLVSKPQPCLIHGRNAIYAAVSYGDDTVTHAEAFVIINDKGRPVTLTTIRSRVNPDASREWTENTTRTTEASRSAETTETAAQTATLTKKNEEEMTAAISDAWTFLGRYIQIGKHTKKKP